MTNKKKEAQPAGGRKTEISFNADWSINQPIK